jgi:hypothetical protein
MHMGVQLRNILASVRRLVAAVLLVIFAVLASGDPLLCPDGCNDQASQRADTPLPAHADCLACRNAISPAVAIVQLSPEKVVQQTDGCSDARPVASSPPPLDHPPRTA